MRRRQPLFKIGAIGGGHESLAILQDFIEQAEEIFKLIPDRVSRINRAAGVQGGEGVARVVGGALADDVHIISQRHGCVQRAR